MTKDLPVIKSIFETDSTQFQEAFKSFIEGRTPAKEIKTRPMRGGGTANYVNTYYMTEQIGLLTGFRWSSECLEEKALPDWNNPRELGAKMRVTVWDREGKQYQHTSWGQKDVAVFTKGDKTGKPMSIFDDMKAAYSDGIKKCLSYFGIARDIYGGKELEFFASDDTISPESTTTSNSGMDELDRYITSKKLSYDQVFQILNISSLDEIKNFKLAYDTIKNHLEGK